MLSKKMVLRVGVWLLLAGLATGATWAGRHPPKPEELAHKEGCYVEEIKDVLPFGEEITPAGSCVRIVCEKRYIDYASCGVVAASPPCYVTRPPAGDYWSYPDCCPYVKCDENNLIV